MTNTLNIAPLRDLLLIEPMTTQRETTGKRADGTTYSIWLDSSAVTEHTYGVVLRYGPDTKHCVRGDVVLYDQNACIRADSNDVVRIGQAATGNTSSNAHGSPRLLVRENDVLAILSELDAKDEI
jgi:co-chaperonin GroES (HSP10)